MTLSVSQGSFLMVPRSSLGRCCRGLAQCHQECLAYFTQRQIRAVPDDAMIRLVNIETFGTPKVGNAISVNFQFAVTKGVQDMHALTALSTSLLRSTAPGSSSSAAGSAPALLLLHYGWSFLGRKLELEVCLPCAASPMCAFCNIDMATRLCLTAAATRLSLWLSTLAA